MDTKNVLFCFGKRVKKAKDLYYAYVKEGVALGKRPELVGGGLIRSVGGWEEVKKLGVQERIRSDQRILGDSDFVLEVLKDPGDKFERVFVSGLLGNLDTVKASWQEVWG